MQIKRYVSELMASNMYVIQEDRHAIVIDPYDNIFVANLLHIDKIILTHEHYDHISGVNVWREITSAPVLCSKAAVKT